MSNAQFWHQTDQFGVGRLVPLATPHESGWQPGRALTRVCRPAICRFCIPLPGNANMKPFSARLLRGSPCHPNLILTKTSAVSHGWFVCSVRCSPRRSKAKPGSASNRSKEYERRPDEEASR